ncbi:MAG: DNA recombination protein RmuC [Nitrospinae bacterium]|nr:DNA recombination protein RmuC [Nitrospinota bacterium]
MTEILLISLLILAVAAIILLVVLLRRGQGGVFTQLPLQLEALEKRQERIEQILKEEMGKIREEASLHSRQDREELANSMKASTDSTLSRMAEIANLQKNQLDTFSRQLSTMSTANEQKLEKMRETVEGRLKSLQEDNSKKLEQMRATVDEKLHATLEKRLGESFQLVSVRLEQVHKGLGEMQTLATGVGDLKRVLSNVKTRGALGEVQLENLLEQLLTVEQYAKNVAVRPGSNERVDFAVKMPGRDGTEGGTVWLPIDAKFPQEDYQRLLEAQEAANASLAEEAGRLMESRIRLEAKNVKEKYIDPPHTTDFGIIFLPIEGLYAEVLRRPGLFDSLQREFRVLVAGPTTLAAMLNSLQMGFRTLAIEKRSSEVWALLGAVKTEFGRFGEILEKTKKKLQEAGDTIDTAATRSRAIQRKLKDVQELPAPDPMNAIGEMGEAGGSE